ncbi:hypothetical protein [Paenibacillus terreus]
MNDKKTRKEWIPPGRLCTGKAASTVLPPQQAASIREAFSIPDQWSPSS